MLELLKRLCAVPGVSGNEDAVRQLLSNEITAFADSVETDAMGNLIAFRKGSSPSGKTLMLAAHMDEIGVIVRHISGDGTLKFDFVGGVDRRVAVGKRVRIGDMAIPGVIALKAAHLSKGEKGVPNVSALAIDIGVSSREEAEQLVALGDTGVFESPVRMMGQDLIKARAIDDRVGCAMLVKLIQKQPVWDTYYVFTVQEEVGTRGAMIAANRIAPDIALILEGTTAADLPSVPAHKRICAPGNGVVIPFMDRGTIYDRGLYKVLCDLADAEKIKRQTKQYISGGTDAAAIQRSGAGVRTAGLAVAVRNIHSPCCVASVSDFHAMLQLAERFLERIEDLNA